MQLAAQHRASITLLMTDVVMPIMSGPEVAKAVTKHVPGLKVLFMSGYSDHASLRSGELKPAVNFIQKPFSAQALAKKVREAIEA
jgi:DNA-binding NtrC family response regulator